MDFPLALLERLIRLIATSIQPYFKVNKSALRVYVLAQIMVAVRNKKQAK